MALEQKQFLRLGQQQALVMTPQLRQAIKVLQVSRIELEQLVDQELSENPLLEEEAGQPDEEAEEPPRTEERLEADAVVPDAWEEPPVERDSTPEIEPDRGLKEIDWKEYLDNYSNDWHGATATPADFDEERRPSIENTLVRGQSLYEHLLWQLRMKRFGREEEEVAARILGNIDEDGYLRMPIEEIAFQCDRDFDLVETLLHRIQDLDPPGVAARDLRECILLQLRARGEEGSVAATIVRDHLDLLENRRLDRIAKETGTSLDEVAKAAQMISTLEPKPGRNFGEGDVRYIVPDIFVRKVDGEYQVELNEDGMPRLRVSSYYRHVLGAQEQGEAKRYILDKLRAARYLIESIQRRQKTLWLVTRSIVRKQRDFLDNGVAHLKPMVLRDVAEDVKEDNEGRPMHESTVSRATANKYVHTPQGTFELKFFFTSGVKREGEDEADAEGVSAKSVQDRIRALIEVEDRRQPLSDQHIAELLSRENVKIARRTVAKYRELLRILPSSKRRQGY